MPIERSADHPQNHPDVSDDGSEIVPEWVR
jgi:hypothetical protein